MDRSSAAQHAEDALRLADQAAGRAAPVAETAVRFAREARDVQATSVAERAWGRALLQCGDVASAVRHLRTSIRLAERAGCTELAGESRIPLAAALVQSGRSTHAVREIDRASSELTGRGRARARAQRADILHQVGRLEQARLEYLVAIPLLRRSGDQLNLQRTLVNRGILHTEQHAFTAAEKDLLEAYQLARALGRELAVGIIAENLGYLETLRGDVPAALRHLSRAEQVIGAHGGQLGPVFMDRSELLLSVGVPSEAQREAQRAVDAFRRERRGLMIPGAELLLANAAFLARDWPTALDHARRARRAFRRQGRAAWAELAQLMVLRAEFKQRSGTRAPAARLYEMVKTLTSAGWPAAALEARLAAATVLIARGQHGEGKELLHQAAKARQRGPAALRARGWYAEALVRDSAGDGRGAASAIRAGLQILDEHSTSLGATDLRAYSAVHRIELTGLGVRAALRDGTAQRVFEWAERGRASTLVPQSVLPPDDPVLAKLLSELRATARDMDRATTPSLRQHQIALERRIRDHTRQRRGDPGGRRFAPIPVAELATALGDRALVEFVQLDGSLHALSLVDGRLRVRDLGPVEPVTDLVGRLPFALQRIARHGDSRRTQAATSLLTDAASKLDARLLGPLTTLDNRPLVVVPTGPLHSLPWSVLPSCVGRPVTVSPSATLWHTACARPLEAASSVAAVAGPGLAGAREEARSVALIHGTRATVDDAATVEAVLGLLRTAGVVHLAAHGHLAVDNPLFTHFRMHDGPLVVYDLERQSRAPHTVVLASCDSARSLVVTGDELLGVSAAFIARGAAQLIASVMPVPDAETAPLMTALHRELAAGLPAPDALAAAQRQLRDTGPRAMAAAAGFVCVGSGTAVSPPR